MRFIKVIPHVLVFDKNNKHSNCINKPDEIEMILTDSPILLIHNKDSPVGYILHVQNRSKTENYYGDIVLNEEWLDIENIKMIDSEVRFSKDNPNKIESIITYIERV